MATIRKRQLVNSYYWEVFLRRKGVPFFSVSFHSEQEAVDWVKDHEFKYMDDPELYRRMYGKGHKTDSVRYQMRIEREKKRKGVV
jgi:hypothetical protein